jgi:hypothetical protein
MHIFTKWGLPQAMKFDNGKPFGDPQRQTVSLITLWLIGVGIKVIFNRPRVPQDNAKVERCQGVTKRWADYDNCSTYEQLQANLNAAVLIQREQYPVTRLGHKTRLQVYPDLDSKQQKKRNPYCPSQFELNRVYCYLANHTWQRKVTIKGQVDFWGIRYTIDKKFAGQILDFKMDALDKTWMAWDCSGNLALKIHLPFTSIQLCHISNCQ